MHIIGRKAELQQLDEYMQSGKAEFVALYGRRRVGKTYLVEEYYNHRFAFNVTGVIDGTRSEQIVPLPCLVTIFACFELQH